MTFIEMLQGAQGRHGSMLCVGLDPEPARFPGAMKGDAGKIFDFCARIADATADLVIAFKPQIAYFAAHRAEAQLEKLMAHLRSAHPQVPVILDAKRGDIGSTAEMYAREAFERYRADAVTVNPYLGRDSVEPFLAYRDKGVILLCRTSNPGGSDLQFLEVATANGTERLFEHVARLIAGEWDQHGQCALVVGATYPNEIRRVRELVGDMPLLVPGIGAQGGDVEATVKAGCNSSGMGLVINSSRAILYAGTQVAGGEDFAAAARQAALQTRDEINRYRVV